MEPHTRHRRGFVAGVAALVLALAVTAAPAQDRKPNVVVIMTDDVGWGDLGSYGGGVMRGAPTPHLDRLAAEGMRFVNYYGQASCTAGRASFITGRIPIRSALSLVLVPGDPNHLSREEPTIAEHMKKAGYTTVHLGKWHLGDVPAAYPIEHGFGQGAGEADRLRLLQRRHVRRRSAHAVQVPVHGQGHLARAGDPAAGARSLQPRMGSRRAVRHPVQRGGADPSRLQVLARALCRRRPWMAAGVRPGCHATALR